MIVLLWLACGPQPRTWPNIDDAALQARIAQPTAPQPEPKAVVQELVDILQAGGDLTSIPAVLVDVLAEPGTKGPTQAEDDVVSGTSAFFEVACPGNGPGPDPDFARGLMRLEGPFLLEDGSLPALGPLFLSFAACELGATVTDGGLRARWLPDDQRLLAIGDIATAAGAATLELDLALDLDPAGAALSVAQPRGTITLAFGADQVRVDYADGAYACTLAEPVTCSAAE